MLDYRLLRDAALFENLPDAVLQMLAAHSYQMELPAGATLFRQNDPGDALYLLQTGQVHLVRQYPDGEQVILTTEGPYYLIGELSVLAGQPRTTTVVAVSDCTLIALSRESLLAVCHDSPLLAERILEQIALRLYRLNLQARENAIGNVAARVASVLLLLADGKNGPVAADVRPSRVARATATDADVVERLFERWSENGYITYDTRRLTIRDVQTLRDIAG
jgi:CRP-like cAMP-binding protein